MAYDVRVAVKSRLDSAPMAGGLKVSPDLTPRVSVKDANDEVQWHVDLESLGAASDGSTVLAAQLIDRGTSTSPTPGSSVGETFLVRLGSRCDVREFAWRSEGDLAIAKQQQQMLSGLGWLAPREGERRWSGSLLDSLGRLKTTFEQEDDLVRGQVMGVVEIFGSGPEDTEFEVAKSSIEIVPRAGEWLDSLSVELSVGIVAFGRPMGSLESSLHATRVDPGSWTPAVSSSTEGWTWGLLLDQADIKSSTKAKDSKLAGVPLENVMKDYFALLGEEGKPAARSMLVEWLQANPAGALEVLEQLQSGRFGDDKIAASGVIGALGQAQTRQAGEALVALVDGKTDTRYTILATWSLTRVENPTKAMVAAMTAVADRNGLAPEIRSTVQLSLGAFAQSNAERSPEVAAMAREQIEGWLANPADTDDLASSLLAAGNAGHDEMLPAIEPHLDHEDPNIRKNATRALRRMSPEESYPRLTSRMSDENSTVRASAIEAMMTVSKNRGAPIPEPAVGTAIDRLDAGAVQREHKVLLSLLGHASNNGSKNAKAALEQRFERARRDDDASELRELGQYANNRWTAQ